MYRIKRTKEEIDAVLNETADYVGAGTTKFWGMTFEEGLREMFFWLTKDQPEAHPMEG